LSCFVIQNISGSPGVLLLSRIQKIYRRKGEKYEKFQSLKNFIFLNPSNQKMVPKGSSNGKSIQSMLASLETAKNC
jgi:hypothetical protein